MYYKFIYFFCFVEWRNVSRSYLGSRSPFFLVHFAHLLLAQILCISMELNISDCYILKMKMFSLIFFGSARIYMHSHMYCHCHCWLYWYSKYKKRERSEKRKIYMRCDIRLRLNIRTKIKKKLKKKHFLCSKRKLLQCLCAFCRFCWFETKEYVYCW